MENQSVLLERRLVQVADEHLARRDGVGQVSVGVVVLVVSEVVRVLVLVVWLVHGAHLERRRVAGGITCCSVRADRRLVLLVGCPRLEFNHRLLLLLSLGVACLGWRRLIVVAVNLF